MKAVQVSKQELRRLEKVIRQRMAPVGLVLRVKAIFMLHEGQRPVDVADALGVSDRWVHKWRTRWQACRRLESLYERGRTGRPREISIETRCEVVKIACSSPEKYGVLYRSLWTQEEIAIKLQEETGVTISRSTVQRILSAEGLRPHRVRYWLHSPDPDFRPKVAQVCQLYFAPPPGAIVLSIDEKPMQALRRRYATRYDTGHVRYEFEYKRHGTQVLLAAFDVQTGQVFGRVVSRRTGEALVEFMEQLARRYPDEPIYVIWDNLNTHHDGKDRRWTLFNNRHGGRFHFVYTPVHASWVNQIEIWFSILQRRIIRNGNFGSKQMLRECVEGFIDYWNEYEAHPFNWKFSGRFEHSTARKAA